MSSGWAMPAGSSRERRLDPFTLPVRFPARDGGADERLRFVELSRERVTMRRAVRGIPMAVSLPLATYLGIVVRVEAAGECGAATFSVMLEHRDQGLSLSLFCGRDCDEAVVESQVWARVLGLPLLVDENGRLRDANARVGALHVGTVKPRRRRRSALKSRRPSILLRRKIGRSLAAARIHRGEREIIART
ncbi:MAG: hypothetical protein HY056_06045 [Proteobacteria bacterium]|nr:hypothetical protein [Pseudomonadota bacterium]